jgi:NADPH-dependent 2,4-dienoyl-CoA reductase/sulfur reductase-like enzyme
MVLDALVIGAGPAGLMAAEELVRAGRQVVICEAKQTPARKFLMAGKSGLNVTKDEDIAPFVHAYDCPDWLEPMLREFGPREVIAWCRGLGVDVFTGTSGRVFLLGVGPGLKGATLPLTHQKGKSSFRPPQLFWPWGGRLGRGLDRMGRGRAC